MDASDSFDLVDYNTIEEVEDLLDELEHELSTLRGYRRGAKEKLERLKAEAE